MVQQLGLEQLHRRYFGKKFPLPDMTRGIEYIKSENDDNGEMITTGFIKALHEAIFITDLAKPRVTRTKALIKVADELERYLIATKSEQVHCFVSPEDIEFARLLVGRFNFQLIKDIPLVRNF